MQNETRQQANLQEKPYKITGPNLRLKWIFKMLKNGNSEKSRWKRIFQKYPKGSKYVCFSKRQDRQMNANANYIWKLTPKWTQPIVKSYPKRPKIKQKREFPTQVETERKPILSKNAGEKWVKNVKFWQSTFYGQFWEISKSEKWKIREFPPPFKGVS